MERSNGDRSFDSDSESEYHAPSAAVTTAVVPSSGFGSPSTAPTTEAPQQRSGFSFGGPARTNPVGTTAVVPSSGFGFGSPSTAPTTEAPQQRSGFSFGGPAGFGGSAPTFGGATSATRTTGIFGRPSGAAFGATTTTTAASGFGASPAATANPFGTSSTQQNSGFSSFGATVRATEVQPSGGGGNPHPVSSVGTLQGGFGGFGAATGSFGNPQPAGGFGATQGGNGAFGAATGNAFGGGFGFGFGFDSPAMRHQRIRSSLFQFMSQLSKESDCDDFSDLLDECIAVTSAVKVSYFLSVSMTG